MILGAASQLFAESGFAAATMDQIAERAEVNVATVYYYYPNKEILYLACLERAINVVLPKLEAASRRAKSSRERLRKLVRAYYQFFRDHPESQSVIQCLQSKELDPNDEETKALVERVYTGTRHAMGILTRAIAAGVASGELRRLDPRETAALFWASLNGVLQMAEHKHVFRDPTETQLLDRWLDLMCGGLEAGGR